MTTASHRSPTEQCDLVMKGGITSGVVYPPAVLELRNMYRFRSIGGSSAGAIAAALTAAAEYKREDGGFDRFEDAQRQVRSGEFLFSLFQPSERARPLMDTLLEFRSKKHEGTAGLIFGLCLALVRKHPAAFWLGVGLGVAAGVLLFLLAALSTGGSLSGLGFVAAVLFLAVLFGALGGLLYGTYNLYRILSNEVVQNNLYGMCTGRGEDLDSLDETVLTDWLYAKLSLLANKEVDEPLTFDDLASKKVRVGDGEQESVGISLRMVTTNLNHGQPYVFPNKETTFIFKEQEMLRFFPRAVVAYMREHRAQENVKLPDGCHFLPEGNELPVIVAVRMSLAFPVLLSTIPLYTIKPESLARHNGSGPQELHEDDLQRNLFSDGGICSNFPIHFFDAWLPKRPTFGINLVPSKPKGQEGITFSVYNVRKHGDDHGGSDDVWLPPPEGWENAEYTGFQGLGGFARAIFSSAQNYRDNTQSRLPSYRERVVQVRLNEDEGGLNLHMPNSTIREIERKGERAASELLGFNFNHHLWVRFRVLMNLLETHLEEANQVLESPALAALLDNEQGADFPYARTPEWREEARRRLGELTDLVKRWEAADSDGERQFFFSVSDADPGPELRVTPEL
ncbi:MAG TPA: patatin-like phospholipase family protein [Rubrobacter sp.]|jgi:predicted acylesterase/phospholipase RssA|nr:patatin-like phospholipase family protein [Rubrobacter sp.]